VRPSVSAKQLSIPSVRLTRRMVVKFSRDGTYDRVRLEPPVVLTETDVL
jgi:hypothetical protein